MFKKILDALTGRKTLMGILTLIIGVCLECFLPQGLSATMLALLQFVAVGFFLGNGLEHFSEAIKKKKPNNSDVNDLKDIMRKVQQGQLIAVDQIAINQKQTAAVAEQIAKATAPRPPVNTDEQY